MNHLSEKKFRLFSQRPLGKRLPFGAPINAKWLHHGEQAHSACAGTLNMLVCRSSAFTEVQPHLSLKRALNFHQSPTIPQTDRNPAHSSGFSGIGQCMLFLYNLIGCAALLTQWNSGCKPWSASCHHLPSEATQPIHQPQQWRHILLLSL